MFDCVRQPVNISCTSISIDKDAKNFTELGRATTDITSIPYGFHHTFIQN